MKPTVHWNAFSGTSFALAGSILCAGLAACGGISASPVHDAAVAPIWPADVTVNTCDQYASLAVGSYVLQNNYWNETVCPGTQCMEMNNVTGAFSVTQGPLPCGDNVASYPNVLYGCSFGTCSPATMLPMPVSAVSSVTSSWSWGVGATAKDRYNVAYDIWFCPDDNCGINGFGNGLELMIWLDYKNVHGWETHLGSKTLAGYTWDVWTKANMLAGQATESWTYLTYMIKPSQMVTSVTDLDLNAFFQDALARGLTQSSWYLYAIQAGMEVRIGGIPYNHNSFSVTLNGVTPSFVPGPDAGPVCDVSAPSADGQLDVTDNYVTVGPLHGYANAWAWVGPDSSAIVCSTPTCTGSQDATEPVSCSPAFPPTALCTAGSVAADPTYDSVAGLGFNLNQDKGVDAGAAGSDDGGLGSPGAITIPKNLAVSIEKSGNLTGNSYLRLQLTDENDVQYCYGGSSKDNVPITSFNTKCWNNTGDYATPSTPFKKLDVIVPSSAAVGQPFAFCITNVVVE